MVRPSALAVVRLTTSSTLVGNSTGSSAGLYARLATALPNSAARRYRLSFSSLGLGAVCFRSIISARLTISIKGNAFPYPSCVIWVRRKLITTARSLIPPLKLIFPPDCFLLCFTILVSLFAPLLFCFLFLLRFQPVLFILQLLILRSFRMPHFLIQLQAWIKCTRAHR